MEIFFHMEEYFHFYFEKSRVDETSVGAKNGRMSMFCGGHVGKSRIYTKKGELAHNLL